MNRPRGALVLAEPAPAGHHPAKGRADAELGVAASIFWRCIAPTDLPIPGAHADKRPTSAGLGYIEYFHIEYRGGVVPASAGTNASAAAGVSAQPASPMPHHTIRAP